MLPRLLIVFALLSAPLAEPAPTPAAPSPTASPVTGAPVILFLIDNSASLPPLDPDEKRVAALEKMFTFLQGQPYRHNRALPSHNRQRRKPGWILRGAVPQATLA